MSDHTGKTTIENPEQASTNFYWTYETEKQVFNLQTTIRGILTFDQIKEHIKSALEATAHVHSLGGQAKQVGKSTLAPLPETPVTDTIILSTVPEPTYVPVETGVVATQNDTFDTQALLVTITNGKKYFKVKGGAWVKYGVTVWDEVLVKAGISPGILEGQEYKLEGYKATFVRKADGKPDKIIKLEKSPTG